MNERIAANVALAFNLALGGAFILFIRLISPYFMVPSRWPWLVLGGLYLALCIPVVRAAGKRVRALLVALFFAPLVAFPLNGQERFLRDLFSVEPGMTRTEVDKILGGYIRGTGWPANPYFADSGELTIPNCEVFRHSTEGDYDSDWGVVCFADGRVSSVDFWPD